MVSSHRRVAQGQGILEMIIAIGILTTGLLSTMTLTTASLAATKDGETRLVATNLSREGIEVVRALRDSAWLAGQPWNAGLVGVSGNRTATLLFTPSAATPWVLDFSVEKISEPLAAVFLGVTPGAPDEHLYTQTLGGTPPPGAATTIYQRLIALYPICRNTVTGTEAVLQGEEVLCGSGEVEVGLDVLSTVQWTVKRQQHSITTEEYLYDWR